MRHIQRPFMLTTFTALSCVILVSTPPAFADEPPPTEEDEASPLQQGLEKQDSLAHDAKARRLQEQQRYQEERARVRRGLVEEILLEADRTSYRLTQRLRGAQLASHPPVSLGMFQDETEPAPELSDSGGNAGGDDGMVKDETGTDPRDFSSKLMPYTYYTELENGLEVRQLNLFGMYAFTTRFALTYDLPLVKEIDYSGVDAFKTATGGIGAGSGFGEVPSGGVPFDDLDPDGDVIGMGDLNLRFFYRPEAWEWSFDDGNSMGKPKGVSLMPVLEMTFPTATEDVLSGEAWIVAPGVVLVADIPGDPPFGLGFFAMMNFLDFDVIKDDSRGSTTRYRGRWFWMQPLSKPGPGLLDGLYVLTELQPVYDFMTSDFDFWIGPEFGKALPWGAIYAKPGWGIDTEPEDRDFSFEVGVRYFF